MSSPEAPRTEGTPSARRGFLALLFWLGVVGLGLVLSIRPEEVLPPPPGWTIWSETGATRAVLPTGQGAYAGGVKGLFLVDEHGAAARVDVPEVRGLPIVNALDRTDDGALWVCMDQGLGILVDGGWTILTEGDGLPEGRVASMAFTEDGYVWLGTASGAVRLPLHGPWTRDRMVYLGPESGLQHDRVQAIVEDEAGGIWFGTYGAPVGGLSRYQDGVWSYWTPAEGLPHANVLAIMRDRRGRIWAGSGRDTLGGALVFSDVEGRWGIESAIPRARLAGPIARSIFQDSGGRVWIGSEFSGLAILRGDGQSTKVTAEDGLPAGEALTIAEGADGSIWIGTLNGLVRIERTAVESLLRSTAPPVPQDDRSPRSSDPPSLYDEEEVPA